MQAGAVPPAAVMAAFAGTAVAAVASSMVLDALDAGVAAGALGAPPLVAARPPARPRARARAATPVVIRLRTFMIGSSRSCPRGTIARQWPFWFHGRGSVIGSE